ncbi:aldo/keto reductase [Bdellovibrio bacteriovorus]|uniref:aldo/keto reductase n=1 Tax=Bdellovibrio bacteriovorus TaxID=959 RepID=UPI0035A5E640
MKYRDLGRSGIKVSEIGLGCSGFWGDKRFPEKSAVAVVQAAFDEGVNFFDTGSNYSNFNAEPQLGRAVKEILKTSSRDRIVISTKAGSNVGYAPTVADDDLYHSDFSPDALRESCIRSIKNLNCEYIDVFQLHGFKLDLLNDEMFKCFGELKKDGLVRAIGVNTHFKSDLHEIAKFPDIFDMVLIDANLLQLDRSIIIEELSNVGIGVAIGTVLAQGHLVTKKIGSLKNLSFFWYLARTLLKPTTRDFSKAAAPMRSVLKSIEGFTPAQAAFSYMLRDKNISSCVFGTTNLSNLKDAISASSKILSDEDARRIRLAAAKIPSLSR